MQDKNLPLVTIVIPCYNHSQFIQQSIQSIVEQTYDNIELIVIDDGSQDKSVEKITELVALCEKRFKRFKFISRENKGLSATLNEGLFLSTGIYWAICSSDDYYHKDKIKSQIKFFIENPDVKFCITGLYVVDDLDNVLVQQTMNYNSYQKLDLSFENIFTFKVHLPITGMYDKKFIKKELRGFDSKITAEDYDINLRIASLTKIGFINEPLFYYRSPEMINSSRKRMPVRVDVSESHLLTIFKYKDHPEYNKALLEWNFRRFVFFSGYTHTKKYALKGFLNSALSLTVIFRTSLYKSLFRLFFCWKKND